MSNSCPFGLGCEVSTGTRVPASDLGLGSGLGWLSTKDGKIIVDCLEERHTWSDARVRVRVRG